MTPREFLESYKEGFGGGMIPFDTVYYAASRNDPNLPEAEKWKLGVYAVLEAFVTQFEHAEAGNEPMWFNGLGLPAND